MDTDWPLNPCPLEHPVKWSGDVVERLALFLSGKQIGVPFYRVGLLEDPEYLSVSQVKNGLWKEEDIEKVETMLKRFNRQARVSGGTWYN